MSEEKEHQRCAADTESADYVHIDNVVYHLDDIEVGEDGKCAWTDVANALTHIKLCREHIRAVPQRVEVTKPAPANCIEPLGPVVATSAQVSAVELQKSIEKNWWAGGTCASLARDILENFNVSAKTGHTFTAAQSAQAPVTYDPSRPFPYRVYEGVVESRPLAVEVTKPACECGFAADVCKTNPCFRKQIASAGLSPVPDGYSKLPAGMVCKCFKMWRDTNGDHWCCTPSPFSRPKEK